MCVWFASHLVQSQITLPMHLPMSHRTCAAPGHASRTLRISSTCPVIVGILAQTKHQQCHLQPLRPSSTHQQHGEGMS